MAVAVWRGREAHERPAAVRPRLDESGAPVAWLAEFTATVSRPLEIEALATWEDQGGCGAEYLGAGFGARPRGNVVDSAP